MMVDARLQNGPGPLSPDGALCYHYDCPRGRFDEALA